MYMKGCRANCAFSRGRATRAPASGGMDNNGSVLFDASVDEGYQFYRIPSLLRVAAAAGTWLLAFCEGRQQRKFAYQLRDAAVKP